MPIARPAILSGLLLAWLRAFGEFGATVMVAYHPYSLPVYTYVAFGSQGLPAMLPVLVPTLALAVLIMVLSTLAGSRASRTPAAARLRHRARRWRRTSMPHTTRACPAQPRSADLDLPLQKRLGNFHLDIAWSPQARRLAIVGPSGSGKSLTLKMIAGIEPCDRGSIVLDGRDIASLEPAAARHRLCAAKLRAVSPSHGERAIVISGRRRSGSGKALDRPARPARPGNTGARMRCRSASNNASPWRARWCALPVCCLLDEPFSALDAPLRARLRREMLALQSELTATTILVTHDPAEAAMLADEILVFENGRVLQSGPTDAGVSPPQQRNGGAAPRRRSRRRRRRRRRRIPSRSAPMWCSRSPDRRSSPARTVGWTVSPARVRLSEAGRYAGSDRSRHPCRLRPSDQRSVLATPDRCRRRLHRSAARQRLPLRHRSRRRADLAARLMLW